MKNLNIKCGCETAAEIKVTVLIAVTPVVAQILCVKCELAYVSFEVEQSHDSFFATMLPPKQEMSHNA